eukprot:3231289-Alexandrium_andersonii.AAC.1
MLSWLSLGGRSCRKKERSSGSLGISRYRRAWCPSSRNCREPAESSYGALLDTGRCTLERLRRSSGSLGNQRSCLLYTSDAADDM